MPNPVGHVIPAPGVEASPKTLRQEAIVHVGQLMGLGVVAPKSLAAFKAAVEEMEAFLNPR